MRQTTNGNFLWWKKYLLYITLRSFLWQKKLHRPKLLSTVLCHPASLLVFCKTCKLFWAFPHLFARTLSGDSDVPSFQPVASIQVLFFRTTLGSMKHSGCSGCKICCTARSMQDMFKHICYICYISVLFLTCPSAQVMIHWSTHSFPFFWPFNVKGILRALTLAHLHTCGHLQKMLITSNYLFPDLCGAYVVERVAPKGRVAHTLQHPSKLQVEHPFNWTPQTKMSSKILLDSCIFTMQTLKLSSFKFIKVYLYFLGRMTVTWNVCFPFVFPFV